MANHFLSRSLHTPASSCSLHRFALALAASILIVTTGCSTESLRSITVTPAPNTEVLSGSGQTFQYKATGYYQQGSHPADARDITSSVTWTSGNTSVATVSSTGLVTSVGPGTAVITATYGNISNASNVVVTAASSSTTRALKSITIYPGSQPVGSIGETTQFIALGSYTGDPVTQDLTNLVTWISSDTFVAKIDSTGLVTTISSGIASISALYTPAPSASNPSPATIVGSAEIRSTSSTGTVTLPTLAIYKVGVNASLGSVTATYILPGNNPASLVTLTCGPGASVADCTENLPPGVTVTLTETNKTSPPAFGGWSGNCSTQLGTPGTCTIAVPTPNANTGTIGNVTVGAIFD